MVLAGLSKDGRGNEQAHLQELKCFSAVTTHCYTRCTPDYGGKRQSSYCLPSTTTSQVLNLPQHSTG